jgi:mannosyltransferase
MSTINPTHDFTAPTSLAHAASNIDRRYWSAVLAVKVLPLALGFFRLGEPSIWFDEAATWLNVSRGWRWLGVAVVSGEDCGGFVYALVMKLWTSVFGYGETALRVPSVLFAAALAWTLLEIGRSAGSLRVGVCMALCGAVHPVVLCWSRQSRAYSLELFLTAAYLATLLAYMRSGGRRRASALTLVGTLLALTHVFGVFVVAGGGLYLLMRKFDRSAADEAAPAGRSVAPAIITALLWGVWIFLMQGRVKQNLDAFWIGGTIVEGYGDVLLELVPWYAAAALPLVAVAWLWSRRNSSAGAVPTSNERSLLMAAGLILAMVLIGPAVVSAMSRGAHHFVLPRYFMPGVIPVVVFAGWWLAKTNRRALIGIPLLAVAGLWTAIGDGVYSDAGEDGTRARAAMRYLAGNIRPGDRLYITPQYEASTLSYYGVRAENVRGVGYYGERLKLRDVLIAEPPRTGARNWALVYHCNDGDDLAELGLAGHAQERFGTIRLVRIDEPRAKP